ncbi:site-specific integrase [Sporichthya sp.]|uniref:tyrosine-type recombinase/integrase n=1 Tax=Sporichthya sp. TaxID=65475 RepID=UPI0017D9278C|nr:site-specific integrase [Sporichthya sp.]MBA3742593.1 site-specific integrase [Sporichthya sp.]
MAAVPPRRPEGSLRKRGSSWQASLSTGTDPLTGRRRYAIETHPSQAAARKALNRMRADRDQDRIARTNATFSVALAEWLQVQELEETSRRSYEAYLRNHITPALGELALSKVTPRALERFYAELRRCRARCRAGEVRRDHRVVGEHECDLVRHKRPPGRPAIASPAHCCSDAGCVVVSCPPHECRPLANATINRIHFIISGALSAAVRWGWIGSNPASVAKKPRVPAPQPNPPTSEQAGRILAAAWAEGVEWGTLVWLVMVTGLRRGELVALRWSDVDFDTETLLVRRGVVKIGARVIEKDTKTHRMRRIALDRETVKVLQEHRAR